MMGGKAPPLLSNLKFFIMVTVENYAVRQNSNGESFVALILQGDLELVQSSSTGKFYATARRCSISSTFNESTAALLIGRQIPGTIQKESCEPYEYVIQETGEKITLQFRYVYSPVEIPTVESKVKKAEPALPAYNFIGAATAGIAQA
jgi:hypothetical protein